jgi:predicted metalloprotease with PDZ domain
MNGVDLNLFRFDYDLTWMAFFMDADDRFYARYGGREDADAESHLTRASLLKVMRAVLRWHREGRGGAPQGAAAARPARTPEDIPTLPRMMARRQEKCIHCHDVKVAELRHRQELGTFARDQIFTYPMPSAVGIDLDPDDQDRVQAVRPESPAREAGVRAGDRARAVGGQMVLTAADFAQVLDQTPDRADLPLELRRDGRPVAATLHLAGPWRRTEDPSWRASVHVAGPGPGFWAVALNDGEKRPLGIPAGALALKVTFLFPGHPTPRRAGLRLGDVLTEVDGLRRPMTTRQLHAYCQMNHEYGDKVPAAVLRDGREVRLTLELPDGPTSAD